ncbi:MAG: ABC transporter substrate-binding protein [Lentisphaeria bacterium]|nr:ABC transporter substrate-binding protein [Lentisphaeria bacterium]
MKRPVLHAIFLLFSAMLLTSCGKPEDTQKNGEIRAVSLAPALTELVFYLGGGDSLCGRTDVCTYPPEAEKLTVTGHFADPAAETVLKLKPSHIFANALINPRQKVMFEKAGIKVFLHPCDTMDDYLFWVDLLGRELLKPEAAAQGNARINNWLAENRTRAQNGKRVVFVLWDDPLMVAGSSTLPDTAITLAGGINAAAGEKGYLKCSRECLLRSKPDVLVWAVNRPFAQASEFLRDLNVPLIYEGFDLDVLLRPGPRFPSGVDAMRSFLERAEK